MPPSSRRWPAPSSSRRARTWPPRASSGSGRRTSSSSCGPRPPPPGPRWCRSRPGRDALAHPAAGRRGRGAHDGGHLRPRRPRPQPPVRPDAGAERGARRVPDAGRLRHVLAAHRLGVNPLLTLLITGPTAFVVGLVLHRLLYAPLLAGDAAESLESRSLLLS